MTPRYAIFATCKDPLARFGAAWLGWDSVRGVPVTHPDVPGLEVGKITARSRKYGLHGTLKAPFRLASNREQADLIAAADALGAQLAPVAIEGLEQSRIGRFLALTVQGNPAQLDDLAARCVRWFDPYCAPLTDAEVTRRRKARLSARQELMLQTWGYPFVMEDFRFHITLTDSMPQDELSRVQDALNTLLPAILPRPFFIDAITVMRSDAQGRFHQIHRTPLSG